MAVLLTELERTGAFDRKVLVIIPATGTGWINPVAARSLEMMYNGDTARSDRSIPICPAGFRSSVTGRSRWIPAG